MIVILKLVVIISSGRVTCCYSIPEQSLQGPCPNQQVKWSFDFGFKYSDDFGVLQLVHL